MSIKHDCTKFDAMDINLYKWDGSRQFHRLGKKPTGELFWEQTSTDALEQIGPCPTTPHHIHQSKGNGKAWHSADGNTAFRDHIKAHTEAYQRASTKKSSKRSVGEAVYQTLKNERRVFFNCKKPVKLKTGTRLFLWVEPSHAEVVNKIMQCIRDRVRSIKGASKVKETEYELRNHPIIHDDSDDHDIGPFPSELNPKPHRDQATAQDTTLSSAPTAQDFLRLSQDLMGTTTIDVHNPTSLQLNTHPTTAPTHPNNNINERDYLDLDDFTVYLDGMKELDLCMNIQPKEVRLEGYKSSYVARGYPY